MKEQEKYFFHGKVYYDAKSFSDAVKNFSEIPLTEESFNFLFAMLAKNIWLNLETYNKIPKSKEISECLNKFFIETLDRFLKE